MFSLQPLSGCAFARAVAWRTGLFALAVLLFTPAVLALTLIYDCSRMDGPCFAASFFMVLWVKPAIYGIFILSCIGIVVGRAQHAGLPRWLAAGVILLLFADVQFGISLGFATGRNLALRGFWGGPEPRFFLSALAALGALCVLRSRNAAPEPWRARLGELGAYAIPAALVMLAAAVWGALEAARIYLPAVGTVVALIPFWFVLGRLLGILSFLGPLLLLPIAMLEWRKGGAPGEGSGWDRAVFVAAILMCIAAVVYAITAVLIWVAPDGTLAFTRALSIPINVLNLAAVLAALVLPALIAKMLEAGSSVGRRPHEAANA